MKKFSIPFLVAMTFGVPAGSLRAAPARSFEAHQLKKRHKAQQKDLEQQQRAEKRVMGQHELSAEQRDRFNSNLKMQRRLLLKNQNDESRRAKHQGKVAAHPTPEP